MRKRYDVFRAIIRLEMDQIYISEKSVFDCVRVEFVYQCNDVKWSAVRLMSNNRSISVVCLAMKEEEGEEEEE